MILERKILTLRDRKRKVVNFLICSVLFALSAIALLPLLNVLIWVYQRGKEAFGWDLFTNLPAPVGELGGGMANAFVGTAVLVLLASAIGVPIGLAIGVFLSEMSASRLARPLRFMCDLLTSVPSIVVGLFAYAVWVVPMKGFSTVSGAFALAFIMTPQVARTTEEVLKLVPSSVREAGLALGLPRWRVTLSIVLKGARPGVLTGILLAVSRIAGETAPLLFTSFNNRFWSHSLFEPVASLPVQIYTYAVSPYEDWHRQAWAAAFCLVFFVLIANLTTRLTLGRRRS